MRSPGFKGPWLTIYQVKSKIIKSHNRLKFTGRSQSIKPLETRRLPEKRPSPDMRKFRSTRIESWFQSWKSRGVNIKQQPRSFSQEIVHIFLEIFFFAYEHQFRPLLFKLKWSACGLEITSWWWYTRQGMLRRNFFVGKTKTHKKASLSFQRENYRKWRHYAMKMKQ